MMRFYVVKPHVGRKRRVAKRLLLLCSVSQEPAAQIHQLVCFVSVSLNRGVSVVT